jgi:UDP-glucuronate 4-epimerase
VTYSIANPLAYIDSNIVGFAHILEVCRHIAVENLVYASSSSVYGANTAMPFSVQQCGPPAQTLCRQQKSQRADGPHL